jgi:hypothetical protein
MRTAAAILLILCSAGAARAAEPKPTGTPPPPSSCVTCHAELDGAAADPAKHAADDIHFQKGLSCHDCHGGNPAGPADDIEVAHDEKKGWTGKPSRLKIPQLCARCHADAEFMKGFNPHTRVDQLAEYRTSVHGKRNAAGDEKVAVCVDCHGVHGIRAVSDPRSSVHPTRLAETCSKCHSDKARMEPYGLPYNQYSDYKTSVHAAALYGKGDLGAPTCNDCHGSHGAVPPGVGTVANVCGSCHGREATLFRETEAKRHLDLDACIRCVVCHDNHAVHPPTADMLGVGPKSTCTTCHAEGDPEYKAAMEMGAAAARLKDRLAEAQGLLERAERAGMEVSADSFALREAQDKAVDARVLVHSFDEARYMTAVNAGLAGADTGVSAGRRAFQELRQRRLGLGISLIVILAVIAGLVLKARDLDRRLPQG